MFDAANLKARGMSLDDLIAAMGEDDVKRIPGITITIGMPEGGQEEPAAPEAPEGEPGDMEMDTSGLPPEFADILKKKKEQMRGAMK